MVGLTYRCLFEVAANFKAFEVGMVQPPKGVDFDAEKLQSGQNFSQHTEEKILWAVIVVCDGQRGNPVSAWPVF